MSSQQLFDPGEDTDVNALLVEQLCGEPRELSATDLRLLAAHGPANGNQTVVENMRAAHHEVARLLVCGFDQKVVAEQTGYSEGYISTLVTKSGAFKELLAYYSERKTQATFDYHSKLHSAAGQFLDSLQQDIINREELLTPEFKLKALKELLNFTGYKPVEKSEHRSLNVSLDKGDIVALKGDFYERTYFATPVHQSADKAISESTRTPSSQRPALSAGGGESREPLVGPGVEGQPATPREPQGHDSPAAPREEVRTPVPHGTAEAGG